LTTTTTTTDEREFSTSSSATTSFHHLPVPPPPFPNQTKPQLSKLGVDIIEAGFPVASPDDFEAVKAIALDVGNNVDESGYVPVICGLSRTRPRDLEVAWDAVKGAKRPRVHTFIATSKIHMEHKLRMSEDEVVENAVNAVKHLRSLGCEDIEFSPEDAGRSEPRFLYRVLGEVIKAGATTLNIPDTTGWCMPHEFGALIADLIKNTPGSDKVVWSTHCQNDLGLATANSLAGAMAGARQIESTINGIGERAGNASLEEVVMALAKRGGDGALNDADGAAAASPDTQPLAQLRTGVRPVHITATSRMVCDYSGMPVQPHKAIVGANAFAHESGIHQDGMLKSKATYEIISPEEIGLLRADGDAGIVLGKHSGRAALRSRLSELGFDLEGAALDDFFKRFKTLADSRKKVTDDDVLALLSDEVHQPTKAWELRALQVVCGTGGMPTATAKLLGPDGIVRSAAATGTGPVDAAYKAIDSLVRVPVALSEFSVQSVTEGIEALAATRVTVRPAGGLANEGFVESARGGQVQRSFTGSGTCEDIVVASARAYVSALNKVIARLSAESEAARRGEGEESGSEVEKGARATAGAA